jgi:hypothetical protein
MLQGLGKQRATMLHWEKHMVIPRQHETPRLMWAFIRELDTGYGRSDGCPTMQ